MLKKLIRKIVLIRFNVNNFCVTFALCNHKGTLNAISIVFHYLVMAFCMNSKKSIFIQFLIFFSFKEGCYHMLIKKKPSCLYHLSNVGCFES